MEQVERQKFTKAANERDRGNRRRVCFSVNEGSTLCVHRAVDDLTQGIEGTRASFPFARDFLLQNTDYKTELLVT